MTDINIWTIVAIAFFTGLGSGIGSPIGAHIYEKYIKNKLMKTTSTADELKEKLKIEVTKSIDIGKDIPDKILGKQL